MMNSDELGKMLEGTVSECQAKMTLVNDYLDRFKIQDMRIVAPIRDIERCIDVMLHMLYGHGLDHDHHGSEDDHHGSEHDNYGGIA